MKLKLLSLALSMCLLPDLVVCADPIEKHKLIIVGAGASGIAAATKLISNGFEDFIILEAENRIGGRVYNIPYEGNTSIDMGAQWMVGQKGNVVYEMAKEFNLAQEECPDYFNLFTSVNSSGAPMNKDHIEEVLNIWHKSSGEEEMNKYNGSLGEYARERLQSELTKNPKLSYLASTPAFDQIMDFLGKAQNSLDASDSWFETSAKRYNSFVTHEGCEDTVWKKGGYGNVLKLLLKQMPGQTPIDLGKKLLLNKEVTKINWEDANGVLVTCADGSQYSADKVLITVSLGVFKSDLITFVPPLPPQKKNIIESLFLGTVDKVFVRFPQKWWPDDVRGYNFFWTHDDEKNPLFKDTAVVDGAPWIVDLYGFYLTTEDPLTFLGWISGASARFMETLSDEQIKTESMKAFRFFLGANYTIPEPSRVFHSSWGTNKHFRGSYSIYTLTTDKMNASRHDLEAPLSNGQGKQVLLFAGEASNEHQYGTVNGAVETGWREADRILKSDPAPSLNAVPRVG
ncbi:hypothetical protein M8J77_026487 [Diaphorina citri]|nr:hypothetical protein M8J77_026487 [Diaphorina citri]